MNLSYIISAPDFAKYEYVTLATAKQHLKIDFDYEDELIQQYIFSAITCVEDYTDKFIYPRNVKVQADSFMDQIPVEHLPLLDGTFAVTYQDENDVSQTSEGYELINTFGAKPSFCYVSNETAPDITSSHKAVVFEYESGYTPDTLPDPLRSAILLMISEFYEYRSDRQHILSTRAQALMRPYKKMY